MTSVSSNKQGTVVILTALPIEFEAVHTYGEHWQERECKGTLYEQSIFSTGAWSWHVVIAQIGAGNVGAALEVERAITCFQPQVVFFVGVAGGVKDVNIGDVVVATKVHGYESGKETEHQFLPRPDMGQTSYRLVQQAQAVKRKNDWMARMKGGRAKLRTKPQVFVGPIASGEKVVTSARSDLALFLHSSYNDVLAVEMEARGTLKAIHANASVEALVIRGISDLLDGKNVADAKGSQERAAHHASAFAFELLARLDPATFAPQYRTQTHVIAERGDVVHETRSDILFPPHLPNEPYYPLPGREQQLDHLLDVLSDPQGPVAIVIDGLGGMGKTAIAVEGVRRALNRQLFAQVVGESAKLEQFVGGEIVQVGEAALDSDTLLDTIARQLDHWEIPTLSPQEKHIRLAQLLRKQHSLILVDNLESTANAQEVVARLRGFLNPSRALLTSRQKVYHDFVLPLSLRELDLEDTLFFLCRDLERRTGHPLHTAPREKLVEIYQTTGGAPLALKLVVALTASFDVDAVLRQLQNAGNNLYPFLFRQTWDHLSLPAQLLLIYIGRTVITTVGWEELAGIGVVETEQELFAAIGQLVDASVVDLYPAIGSTRARYGIHQLTRHFITSDLPELWRE
jgi:nucleoside phosphorylase